MEKTSSRPTRIGDDAQGTGHVTSQRAQQQGGPGVFIMRGSDGSSASADGAMRFGLCAIEAIRPDRHGEKPHEHPHHLEVIVLVSGKGEVRFQNDVGGTWQRVDVNGGDLVAVHTSTPHVFRWFSTDGLAYVVRIAQFEHNNPALSGKDVDGKVMTGVARIFRPEAA